MHLFDWVVVVAYLVWIVWDGLRRTHSTNELEGYFLAHRSLPWWAVGLSVMATQLSAITLVGGTGQGYADGMRFVQFYLGLPLAMTVISAVFVPAYYRLRVRTAYEYLEHRFDVRVRLVGGALFLLGRGLATGITIYAPSIILSQILGWPLHATIWAMGIVVVAYTVLGGTRAVSFTQKQQMIVMLLGLGVAAVVVILRLPSDVSLGDAVQVAGALGRMNVVSFDLDFANRYNFWAGLTGGFFLQLSYFGTDQSQVQRYLSGQSTAESRLGLLINGILKVPMQFVVLVIGVMVCVFYVFTRPPVHFDRPTLEQAAARNGAEVAALEARHDQAFTERRTAALDFLAARGTPREDAARAQLADASHRVDKIHDDTKALIRRELPAAETRDNDYVFLSFVLGYLPVGLVGLLLAVILCAAMSAVSSGLIALGASTTVDFYLRIRQALGRPPATAKHDLRVSQLATVIWAAIAIGFASVASLFANLIEAVNILGSIFYGTILGMFVVAFFLPRVTATPTLIAAIIAQLLVVVLFFTSDLGFLWYNVIGCGALVIVSLLLQALLPPPRIPPARVSL
jgi:Na+/proline symporter